MAQWDLIAFMETSAKNGLQYVAGVDHPAYVVSGDDIEVRDKGSIVMATTVTAAIANFVQSQFHRKLDPNWVSLNRAFVRDQAGAVDFHNLAMLDYPILSGDVLNFQADNGNNAQYEAGLLAVNYGSDPMLSIVPPRKVPKGARWVSGVGAATNVAANWTDATITWSETFNKDQLYSVLGMWAQQATGYATVLSHRGKSPTVGYYCGVPCGDSAVLNQPLYGDFGQFFGDQPPNIKSLASAGDTAQYVGMLIV